MDGGSGADLLAGGMGVDVVSGGSGDDTIAWRHGEGNDTVDGGHGADVLRLEDTGLSICRLLYAIEPDEGSPQPRIGNGQLVVTGVSGTVTIGYEVIRFSNLGRITLSEEATHLRGC